MNDIDFIKWMCEKAGWEIIIYSDDDYEILPENKSEDEDFFTSIGHLMSHYAWKALLQSAIEGVNREYVYNKVGPRILSNLFCYEAIVPSKNNKLFDIDWNNQDKAKESALRCIYEQKRNNGT